MPVHGDGVGRTPPSLVHELPQTRRRHTRTKGETMVEPSATLSASPTSPEGGVDAAKSR